MIDSLKSICVSIFKIITNKFKRLKKTQKIVILSVIVILLIILLFITNSKGKLTEKNYNKVEIGMTYKEVVKLIGECNYSGNIDFPEFGYYSTMCQWWIEKPNGDKPGGVITFIDGVVYSKIDWSDGKKVETSENQKYTEEQKEYDLIYKTKINEAKEECIKRIKEEYFNGSPFPSILDNGKKLTYITPQNITSIDKILVCLDTTNEEVLRIGMRISYTGNGEFIQNTNNFDVRYFTATGIIDAELDLVKDKLYLYYAMGKSENSSYCVTDGNSTEFDKLQEVYNLYPYAYNNYPNTKDEYIYTNMNKEPLKYKNDSNSTNTADTTNTTENSVSLTGIEQAIKDRAFEVTDDLSESKLKAAFTDGSLRFYYDNWEKCLEDAQKLNIITSDKPYLTMEEELEQQYYNEQNYNNQSYNEDYNEQPSEQNNSVSNEQPTLIKTYNTIKKEDSSDYHIIKIYEYSNGEYSYETDWYTYGSIIPSRTSDKRYKTLDEALTSAIQSFEGISLTISDLTEE